MSFRALSSVQHVLLPLYYMRTFVNSLSWAPNRGIPIKSIQYHLSYQENPVSGFLSPHDARFDFRRVDRSLSDISCIQHTYYEQANPNMNSKKPILYGYVRCSYLHLFPSRLELCTPIRMPLYFISHKQHFGPIGSVVLTFQLQILSIKIRTGHSQQITSFLPSSYDWTMMAVAGVLGCMLLLVWGSQ